LKPETLNLKLNCGIVLNNLNGDDIPSKDVIPLWKEKGHLVVNYIYWASYPLIDRDEKYTSALRLSDFLLPDGIGILYYVKKIFNIKLANLNGTDLNPSFIDFLDDKQIPFAFYGATEESISKAVSIQNSKFKIQNSLLYYYQNGYSKLNWDKITEYSVLFVGLGTPKQEIWVADNIDTIRQKKLLIITVGGYFDFLSGKFKRAPGIFRKLNLEWLWRAPHCSMKRNFRNFYIFYYILRDKNKLRKLNELVNQ
jgi:N-acetylglucosaminyldiphosphoundecaprenol N-acetyl-beta-D-mannosaminyltransferase